MIKEQYIIIILLCTAGGPNARLDVIKRGLRFLISSIYKYYIYIVYMHNEMTEKRKEIVFTDEKTNDLSKCFYGSNARTVPRART